MISLQIKTFFLQKRRYNLCGDTMKVKVFDESHEKDLEFAVNDFLSTLESDLIDIKYNVAISTCGEDQIYCFSAMIIYES